MVYKTVYKIKIRIHKWNSQPLIQNHLGEREKKYGMNQQSSKLMRGKNESGRKRGKKGSFDIKWTFWPNEIIRNFNNKKQKETVK